MAIDQEQVKVLKNCRVLLMEDNVDLAKRISEVIKRYTKTKVFISHSREEANEYVNDPENQIDFAIIDVKVPDTKKDFNEYLIKVQEIKKIESKIKNSSKEYEILDLRYQRNSLIRKAENLFNPDAGFQLVKDWRVQNINIPVIYFTASRSYNEGSLTDNLSEYLAKPVTTEKLIYTCISLLKRINGNSVINSTNELSRDGFYSDEDLRLFKGIAPFHRLFPELSSIKEGLSIYSYIESFLNHLKKHYECSTVSAWQYSRLQREIKKIILSTDSNLDKKIIDEISTSLRVKQEIGELLDINEDKSETIIYTDKQNPENSLPIITIPLVNLTTQKNNAESKWILVLVDPRIICPIDSNPPEHIALRKELYFYINLWWMSFTEERLTDDINRHWYTSTLNDLISYTKQQAKIRRVHLFKDTEEENEPWHKNFDWNNWIPRLPLCPGNKNFISTPKDRNNPSWLESERRQAKSLVYWCRWFNSDYDLEKTLNSTHDEGIQHSRTIPIVEEKIKNRELITLITNQRRNPAEIKSEITNLSLLLLDTFSTSETVDFKSAPQSGVLLNSRNTLRYFLAFWLSQSGPIVKIIENRSLSDIEFCRILHCISVLAFHCFGGFLDEEKAPDLIYRMIQMISLVSTESLNIPYRLDIRAHLDHIARGELTLHTMKPFYRDHFYHVLEVCFLGHILLETTISSDNKKMLDFVILNLNKNFNHSQCENEEQEVLTQWYFASLFHDVGYSLDVVNSSQKYLGFFSHINSIKNLQTAIRQMAEQFKSELYLDYIKLKRTQEIDHGLMSALHLSTLLESIAKDTPKVNEAYFLPAIQAIAMHNVRSCKDKIYTEKNLLSFLLAFCDQLQEWRRPRLEYASSPQWFLEKLDGTFIGSVDNGALRDLRISIQYEKYNPAKEGFHLSNQDMPLLLVELVYGKDIHNNYGIFNLWLDATLNFQRFVFDETFPLKIQVTFITPLYRNKLNGYKQPQIHRLRNIAYETHMNFLMDWFPDNKVDGKENALTNKAITHTYDEDFEMLTIDLNEIQDSCIITKGMGTFWEYLTKWKHFNEDKSYKGDYVPHIP